MRKSMVAMLAVGCLTWAAADVGGQGKKGVGGRATPMLEAAADSAFLRFDLNGDGKLNQDEMPESLRSELKRFDRNGDGLIDRLEFREFFVYFYGGGEPGRGAVGGQSGGFGGGGKKAPMGFGGVAGGPGGAFGSVTQGPAKLTAWEYRVMTRDALNQMGKKEWLEGGLNQLGADGWELVAIEVQTTISSTGPMIGSRSSVEYIFRRPGTAKPRADAKPAAELAPKQKAEEKPVFRIFRLKHAKADEVAQLLSQLFGFGGKGSIQSQLRIVADAQANQLLLRGPAQAHVEIDEIIRLLDVPSDAAAPGSGPSKKGPRPRFGGN